MSKSNYPHLDNPAAEALRLSTDERIQYLKIPKWVGYPCATALLARLRDLGAHPKVHRPPCLLIAAHTNNGKTFVLQRYGALNPPPDNPVGPGYRLPILIVNCPPVPDEGRLYTAMLDSLNASYKSGVEAKQGTLLQVLDNLNIGLLALDEIENLLAGSETRRTVFFNVLRFLANTLQRPVVVAGTKDAFRAIGTDPTISNRYEPFVLPRWDFDDTFLSLLVSIERMLPLREPSELGDEELARQFFELSEGLIGEVDTLIRRAAVYAVSKGRERIDASDLSRISWTPPSKRKDAAKLLL